MSLVSFTNLGQYGVIDEVPDHATPHTAWTTANNITFRDDHVQTAKGYTSVSAGDDASTPTLARPQFLLPYYDPDSSKLYWLYPGINDAGAGMIATYDGAANTDRTRAAGVYSTTTRWNGAIVNGLVILNNQEDIPQMWDRTAAGVLNDDFQDLAGAKWVSTKRCAVMRGFRNFFVALDITDTANDPDRNPYEVMHSGIVDPYTPPEWVPAASNRAGSKYIGEGGGVIIDCLPLRGVNIIYTESEAWPMQFIGGNEVFAIGDKALLEYGMLTQGCASAFGAGHHLVVTTGDIIVHDGANAESVIDGKARDILFADIDVTNFVNCFTVSHYSEGEIWFCYPGSGHTYPNKIAKWNIKSGAWSFQELPIEFSMIRYGAVPQATSDGLWDDDTEVWDDDSTVWNEGNYNPTIRDIMLADIGTSTSTPATIANSGLMKIDDSLTFDGVGFSVVLEKTGLIVVGNGNSGPISDPNVDKFLNELWPRIEGGPVNIKLGTAQYIDGPYTWTASQSFDPSSDRKLDFRPIEGYYGAIRFESSGVSWHLDGFDLGVQTTGSRG